MSSIIIHRSATPQQEDHAATRLIQKLNQNVGNLPQELSTAPAIAIQTANAEQWAVTRCKLSGQKMAPKMGYMHNSMNTAL